MRLGLCFASRRGSLLLFAHPNLNDWAINEEGEAVVTAPPSLVNRGPLSLPHSSKRGRRESRGPGDGRGCGAAEEELCSASGGPDVGAAPPPGQDVNICILHNSRLSDLPA